MTNLNEHLRDWDEKIRRGVGAEVRDQMVKIKLRSVPRETRAPLANLARRTGQLDLAFKILSPVVRAKSRFVDEATSAELVEYACALSYLGAIPEARKILGNLKADELPEVFFYDALSNITNWNYEGAAQSLERFIAQPRVDEYWRRVGQLNLAACHVFLGHEAEALELVEKVLHYAKSHKYWQMAGNCFEVSARLELSMQRFERAKDFLNQAESALGSVAGIDPFFITKWRAVIAAMEAKPNAVLGQLGPLRIEALKRRHWETIRDCDYYEALLTGNIELINKLHFGTPYRGFRWKIKTSFPRWSPGPEYILGDSAEAPTQVWSLAEGADVRGQPALPRGELPSALLQILASDLYRPARLGTLWCFLFPSESFNSETSVTRVHNIILRLRNWLKKHEIGIQIDEAFGDYQLKLVKGQGLLLTGDLSPERQHRYSLELKKLRDTFGSQLFSAREAAGILGLSPATVNRLIQSARAGEEVVMQGKGPKARYQLVSN